MKLYRFLSEESALKTIESWTFRVSRILELNDPFEWRFGLTNIRPGAEEIAEYFTQQACRKQHELFGVICFSETADDPVLWSHYADKHRGIVIEVDHFLDLQKIQKMDYTDERPTLDANQLGNPEYLRQVGPEKIRQLFRTKSPGWSYEKEWRVSFDLKDCEARNGSYYTPIPTDFLKRIILGAESTLGVGYIERVLKQRNITDVTVTKARKGLDTFKILT